MICKSYESFFKIMADKTKMEIINLLSKGPKNVTELSQKLGFEQSRVSHNLRTLGQHHFVTVEQRGKARYYSLDKGVITPLLKLIDKHVERYEKHLCKCKGIPWRKRK